MADAMRDAVRSDLVKMISEHDEIPMTPPCRVAPASSPSADPGKGELFDRLFNGGEIADAEVEDQDHFGNNESVGGSAELTAEHGHEGEQPEDAPAMSHGDTGGPDVPSGTPCRGESKEGILAETDAEEQCPALPPMKKPAAAVKKRPATKSTSGKSVKELQNGGPESEQPPGVSAGPDPGQPSADSSVQDVASPDGRGESLLEVLVGNRSIMTMRRP